MDDDLLRRTATHEAGRAVARVRLQLDHQGANLVPINGGLLGASAGDRGEDVWEAERAKLATIACCAGYAALIAAGLSEDDACAVTGDDFDKANKLIGDWALQNSIEVWKLLAVDLMRRTANVAAVALVAQHLQVLQQLDVDYVEQLIHLADGDTTEQEFAEYLKLRRWSLSKP